MQGLKRQDESVNAQTLSSGDAGNLSHLIKPPNDVNRGPISSDSIRISDNASYQRPPEQAAAIQAHQSEVDISMGLDSSRAQSAAIIQPQR